MKISTVVRFGARRLTVLRRALKAVISNPVLLIMAGVIFRAQTSPMELAQAVVERWSAGAEKNFASAYPFREGRDALSAAISAKTRPAGLANVIRSSEGQAVLLISGVPLLPNSGDAMVLGARFSGVYEAREEGGMWETSYPNSSREYGADSCPRHEGLRTSRFGCYGRGPDAICGKGRNGFAVRLNH